MASSAAMFRVSEDEFLCSILFTRFRRRHNVERHVRYIHEGKVFKEVLAAEAMNVEQSDEEMNVEGLDEVIECSPIRPNNISPILNVACGDSLNSESESEDGSILTTDVSDSGSSSDGESIDLADEFLYKGSRVTAKEHVLAVIGFSIRHNLSQQATDELLQLLQIHLPLVNNAINSSSSLYKMVGGYKNDDSIVEYCSICHAQFNDMDDDNYLCKTPNCSEQVVTFLLLHYSFK